MTASPFGNCSPLRPLATRDTSVSKRHADPGGPREDLTMSAGMGLISASGVRVQNERLM